MDKLQAVNTALEALGEYPVNSLDSGFPLVTVAEGRIDRLATDSMATGWWFNTENTTLKPNGDGEIDMGADVLAVFIRDRTLGHLVQRGSRLYNPDEQTYKINANVEVLLFRDLNWLDTPRVFRSWIAYEAGMRLQQTYLGSQRIDQFVRDQRNEAWQELYATHLENEKFNTNTGTLDMALTTQRKGAW